MELIFFNLFKIFVGIIGVLMSIGYYPQAYKIYKTKSSRDVSIISYVIFSFGTLTWLIYGLVLKDLTIIFGFALGVIGSWLVLILSILYRRKK